MELLIHSANITTIALFALSERDTRESARVGWLGDRSKNSIKLTDLSGVASVASALKP